MFTLSQLSNGARGRKTRRRVGRGQGSGLGKTSGRGEKGAGSRSGYKRRYTYEGGQFRTHMKLPIRGFNQTRFRKPLHVINLDQLEEIFQDGETVSLETLRQKGFISGASHGVKVLGDGELTRKVTLEVHAVSKSAQEKLQGANLTLKLLK